MRIILSRAIIYFVLITFVSSIVKFELISNRLYAKSFTNIAIIDLSSDQISEENKKRIRELLQNKFYTQEAISIVSDKSINEYLKKFHAKDDVQKEAAIKEAEVLFADGKTLYENTNYQEAEVKFSGVMQKLMDNIEMLKDNELLINSYAYRALNYTGLNEQVLAITTIKDMYKLDSNPKIPRSINENPKFKKLLDSARRDMDIFTTVTLDIESNQNDVSLYLNGRFIGETKEYKKLSIPKIYSGKHRIVAEKEGYKRSTLEFVAHDENITLKINLLPNDFRQLLADTNNTSKTSMFEFLRKFGQDTTVGANIIVLTSINEERGAFYLRVQLYDVEKDIYTSSFKTSLGDNLKYPGDGIDKLYASILEHMQNGHVIKEPIVAKGDEATREHFSEDVQSEEELFKKFPKPQARADSIRTEDDDANLGKKKVIATTLLLLIVGGLGVGGYLWYKSMNRKAEVVIIPPDAQAAATSGLFFHW